jgi:hypothetical protein
MWLIFRTSDDEKLGDYFRPRKRIPLERATSRWWGHNRGGPDAHSVERPHLRSHPGAGWRIPIVMTSVGIRPGASKFIVAVAQGIPPTRWANCVAELGRTVEIAISADERRLILARLTARRAPRRG